MARPGVIRDFQGGGFREEIVVEMRRLAVWFVLGAAAAAGQPLKFEVATVKPAAPDDTISGVMPSASPGRIEYRNMTLRFALKTHTGTRQIDVYALGQDRADGKLGPKVKPWSGTCASGRAPRAGDDPAMPRCMGAFRAPGLVLEGVTMIPVAEMLSTQRALLGKIVQDRTGLSGPYDIEFEFDFAGANRSDYTGPSIFTALKEQLGLKLEASKGPLQVLVVENASLPGEN